MSLVLTNVKNAALLNESLEAKEKLYVQARVQGSLPVAAARVAGYASPESRASQLESSTRIRAAIEYAIRVDAAKVNITREDCIRGFLDAASMSSTAAEYTAAWKEITKMHGYYAPTETNINVTKREAISTKSDDELLEMAAIDADYEIVEFEN